jgi:hypothetical protein
LSKNRKEGTAKLAGVFPSGSFSFSLSTTLQSLLPKRKREGSASYISLKKWAEIQHYQWPKDVHIKIVKEFKIKEKKKHVNFKIKKKGQWQHFFVAAHDEKQH